MVLAVQIYMFTSLLSLQGLAFMRVMMVDLIRGKVCALPAAVLAMGLVNGETYSQQDLSTAA